jgi:hypothetical protein
MFKAAMLERMGDTEARIVRAVVSVPVIVVDVRPVVHASALNLLALSPVARILAGLGWRRNSAFVAVWRAAVLFMLLLLFTFMLFMFLAKSRNRHYQG